ncbi:MAG: hypothetical protein JWO45_1678 [Spartobacteria bacterium]|nr:hypothetical protein [Spartobacteria bacterium]
MQRPSIWLMLVILLACLFFLREPRLQRFDETFLRWLLKNSPPTGVSVPLTIVEIGRDSILLKKESTGPSAANPISPVEYALFLQAALEFNPTVVAFEPILQWNGHDKDQEQIFLDQAMRVPKLLVAAELTTTPDIEAPLTEIPGFTQVTGRRGGLAEFSGISRQPNEDIRLISTLGFINLPKEISDEVHVPLLFQYRGEVVPSFALQAVLVWMRVTPSEVKIDIGSYIYLPQGKKIPIRSDGTLLVNPNTVKGARHLKLNELLLAAQQHENKNAAARQFDDIRDHIVLARTSRDQAGTAPAFASAIATIQANAFVHRIHWIFDCVFIAAVATVSGIARRFSRIDLVLAAIAVSAGYCLVAIALVSRWSIWLPGVLPLGAVWLLALLCLFAPRGKNDPDLPAIAPSPPSL